MNGFTIGAGLPGEVEIGLGGRGLVLIAGPCQLESVEHAIGLAMRLQSVCAAAGVGFVFKASFDKANRTSGASARGPGLVEGLRMLREVRRTVGVPVLTDVHDPRQCAPAADVVDVLQIPALLSRQTDLIAEAGLAARQARRAVNIKKGQFMAPDDMAYAIAKARGSDPRWPTAVMVTERGTSFGYRDLVVDMRGLARLRALGVPVVFDATHSAQSPAALGASSGGDREVVPILARAAVAVGVEAVFMEVHEDPDRAPSDGPCMRRRADLPGVLRDLVAIDKARRG